MPSGPRRHPAAPPEGGPAARPPHPATVVQPKAAMPAPAARPPHPATVVQPKAAMPAPAARPPHPATVVQPKTAVIQRMEGSLNEARWNETSVPLVTDNGVREEPDAGEDASDVSLTSTRTKPRTRKLHNLSDGESESEDPDIVWRSLRENENIGLIGLRPPEHHDPSIPASAHITAGSRAKTKSAWVSATRSCKVAGAWASESGKRVAKIRVSSAKRSGSHSDGSREVYDLTDPDQAREVFPSNKGSSLNTAKASQEVVIRGGVGPEDVLALYEARKISVTEYKSITEALGRGETVFIDGRKVYAAFRTRTETTKTPFPRLLLELPLIRTSDVLPLITAELGASDIDQSLFKYAIEKANSAEEAAFLYVDIYLSITS